MEVSFSHANPASGNESFLIRFTERGRGQTPCLLVDSGTGVDVDSLLGEDEYLLAILVTHAHSDHYASLGQNVRDGASVYTTPGTAKVLDLILSEGEYDIDIGSVSDIRSALEPITEWESLLSTVRVRPMAVGHCPGATGFIIQFKTDSEWKTLVATGDFTMNRAGGYPSFPDDMLIGQADALFLTGATSDVDDREKCIKALIEHAKSGARTLLTTTGLTGVELGYILGHFIDNHNLSIKVTLAGHTAKLFTALEYTVPHVDTRPSFDSTNPIMNEGDITIAGPQVPTEGASGRLFGAVKNDSNSAVIQLTNRYKNPIENAACTLRSFQYVPHPTEDEIDSIVEKLGPKEVIITHQYGAESDRYKDKYASYVWATAETGWHLLYDGTWNSPPWMTTDGEEYVQKNNIYTELQVDSDNDTWPPVERQPDVNFSAEGISTEINIPDSKLTKSQTQLNYEAIKSQEPDSPQDTESVPEADSSTEQITIRGKAKVVRTPDGTKYIKPELSDEKLDQLPTSDRFNIILFD